MGFIFVLYCAQGGTRTHTALRPGNFKSPASTIPPLGQTKILTLETWAGIEPAMRDLQSPELPLFYQVINTLKLYRASAVKSNDPLKNI